MAGDYFTACENARAALAEYCRCAIRKGICRDDDCPCCEFDHVYELLVEGKANAHGIDEDDADDTGA